MVRPPTPEQRDERVTLPLNPVDALRALLAVEPNSKPVSAQSDQNRADHVGNSDREQ